MKTFTMKIPKLDEKTEKEFDDLFIKPYPIKLGHHANRKYGKSLIQAWEHDMGIIKDFLASKLAQEKEIMTNAILQSKQGWIDEGYKQGFNSALKELKIKDEGRYL